MDKNMLDYLNEPEKEPNKLRVVHTYVALSTTWINFPNNFLSYNQLLSRLWQANNSWQGFLPYG